ncbi:hypothetical protein [Micromonospora arida]|uniref:hypothetical protein n=1 Tax=Micromonospora arida TaxID=2203715 RepID=UPI0033BC3EAF
MKALVTGGQLLDTLATAHQTGLVPTTVVGAPASYVSSRVAAWRLLHDIPYAYLVPDDTMLPAESIRFFHVDPAWLDALAEAALGLGADAPTWQTRAPQVLPATRRSVLGSMRQVRDVRRGRIVVGDGPSDLPWPPPAGQPDEAVEDPPVTGFLLRSALVSRWHGLQVRAWTTAAVPSGADPAVHAAEHPERVVPILRLERLSPGVLIALFGGVPRLVWLEEPHHGVQLGVDVAAAVPHLPAGPPTGTGREIQRLHSVAVRDEEGQPTGQVVSVPMRAGARPGVVDVKELAAALDAARPLPAPRGGAGMSLALLQPPARQRFAGGAR